MSSIELMNRRAERLNAVIGQLKARHRVKSINAIARRYGIPSNHLHNALADKIPISDKLAMRWEKKLGIEQNTLTLIDPDKIATLHERVRYARLAQDLSQLQMGQALDVEQTTYQKAEKGERRFWQNPTEPSKYDICTPEQLAGILKVDVDWLLTDPSDGENDEQLD